MFDARQTTKTLFASLAVSSALLISAGSVQAGVNEGGPWTQTSSVTDIVTDNGGGIWTYDYTVTNTSEPFFGQPLPPEIPIVEGLPVIIDWELPWFADAGISNILSPIGWDFAIETIGVANPLTGWEGIASWQDPLDPWYAGADSPFTDVTEVLHWYSLCGASLPPGFPSDQIPCSPDDVIFPGNSLSDFSFDAIFDETAAPYQASWAFLPVRTGDPAFPLGGGLPASPLTLGTTTGSVPEPSTLWLAGAGLLAGFAATRRKKKTT